MAADWDPTQYERFKAQRAQPFWDLIDLLNDDPLARAVDLGCGTGELTAAAATQLSVGQMTGIDNSPAMLAEAQQHARHGVEFVHGEIDTWTSAADHDLVLANAALQWVPDHAEVLTRWTAALRSGGQLAVQVPANSDHASHLASVAVAHTEPFLSAMGGDPPPDPVADNVLAAEAYAELLYRLGFADPNVRLQVYPHVMPSTAAVVEWTKGTSLTRFFKVLPRELHTPFVDAYRHELIKRVGDHSPYLFAFKRILMHARLG
ncbi:MAG TPA: methyltransferase domain-containing protein [Ilumatobacter sp.]|nr:methyltransferase domain-containing protein [Ilumatobacter sp.]